MRIIVVIGTDTDVGKTHVTVELSKGLRALQRRVWLHKPVACGGWADGQADDGRRLRAAVGNGQPIDSICRFEFPEPASPHLAAAAAGVTVTKLALQQHLDQVLAAAQAQSIDDLIIEGAGGLLAPLGTDLTTISDLVVDLQPVVVVVTRPNLGTINHTALTVTVAAQRGLPVAGLVVNRAVPVADSLSVRTAVATLETVTGVSVLADWPHGGPCDGVALAQALGRLTSSR